MVCGLGTQGTVCCSVVLPPIDRECEEGTEMCLPTQHCPDFQAQREQLNQTQPNSQERIQLRNRLKQRVCNFAQKGVCCGGPHSEVGVAPRTITTSPKTFLEDIGGCDPLEGDCLPGLGQCGINSGFHRVTGGEDADMGQFPATVLLGRC